MSFKVGDKITYRLSCNHGTIVAMGEDYAIVVFDNSDLRIAIRLNELDLHNPPLTPDDLAKMDGQRVWVDDIDIDSDYNGWYVVNACTSMLKRGDTYFSFDFNDIKIYRHKPERNEDMQNPMPELKTGMVVEWDYGSRYTVMIGTEHGDICVTRYGFNPLSDLNSIVKIFQPKNECCYSSIKDEDLTLIWKREAKLLTLTEAQAKLSELMGEDIEIVGSDALCKNLR